MHSVTYRMHASRCMVLAAPSGILAHLWCPSLVSPASRFTHLCHAEGQRCCCSHGSKASPSIHVIQEGELRPQLLDRFGMSVNVYTMQDIASRTRMVLDRMAFEKVCPIMQSTPVQSCEDLPACLARRSTSNLGLPVPKVISGHERGGWHPILFWHAALEVA